MDVYKKQRLVEKKFKNNEYIDWKAISRLDLTDDFIRQFVDFVDWDIISFYHQNMSEDFIREFAHKVNWNFILKYQYLSESFIAEFADNIGWNKISYFKLSEKFILDNSDKLDWYILSRYQNFSEDFMRKNVDKLNWGNITFYQNISEDFIREFSDNIDWVVLLRKKNVSEELINEFIHKIDFYPLSFNRKLSKEFIRKYLGLIHPIQFFNFQEKTIAQKRREMSSYADEFGLEYKNDVLYAFRNHDFFGCGQYDKKITYKEKKEYRDWRCNMDENCENSFGLGIWPKGNTPISVKTEDWGCRVKDNKQGKGRVWAFTLL